MNWYALFVETGKEELVQKYLSYYFDNDVLYSIIPKRKLTERKGGSYHIALKKMFPGYVLVRTMMTDQVYTIIKSTPSIIRVLGNDGSLSVIREEEIRPILKLLNRNEVIDESKIYIYSSKIIVKSGPLEGMEGMIQSVDKRKGRAKVLFQFMNQLRIIDLAVELIELN